MWHTPLLIFQTHHAENERLGVIREKISVRRSNLRMTLEKFVHARGNRPISKSLWAFLKSHVSKNKYSKQSGKSVFYIRVDIKKGVTHIAYVIHVVCWPSSLKWIKLGNFFWHLGSVHSRQSVIRHGISCQFFPVFIYSPEKERNQVYVRCEHGPFVPVYPGNHWDRSDRIRSAVCDFRSFRNKWCGVIQRWFDDRPKQ